MDLLDVARRQIERGELQKAKQVLVSYVRQHPDFIPAWALLAGLISDPTQQVACYRHILDLDPANAQAAAALQRLTETADHPKTTLHCPQCGAKQVVQLVGELKDKPTTCEHCGTELDLPDASRRVEHQHEQDHPSTLTHTVDKTVVGTRRDYPGEPKVDDPARQTLSGRKVSSHGKAGEHATHSTKAGSATVTSPNENKRRRPLPKDRVPDEKQVIQPMQRWSGEAQTTSRIEQMDSQTRSAPGLLKWFQARYRGTVRSDDTTSQQDESSLLLSPEELIEAAGGPLPPEERRKCPECGTTLPKQASRCGWCGKDLSEP